MRPGIEPRTSCSVSQELNHYTCAAPHVVSYEKNVHLALETKWSRNLSLVQCHKGVIILILLLYFFLWPSFTVSVWRASKLSVLKIDKNCNFMGLLHHHFLIQLVWVFLGIAYNLSQNFGWLRITDVWRFNTRNAHMVHILIIQSDFKMVYPA